MLRVLVLHAAIVCLVYSSAVDKYTNSWAVEVVVTANETDAQGLAQRYEFIYKGKVGILDHVYEFVLPEHVYRREGLSMEKPYEALTQHLRNERIVVMAEQQKLHRIVEKSYTDPTDPDWFKQWYLLNTESRILESLANSSRDLNIVPAWIQGYTGSGVVVAVVDTGVYHNHTDLAPNYDDSLDINIMTEEEDAFALSQHGTSVAGVIAMVKDNNKCGVGIAYNSTITGINLGDSLTDVQEARALGHKHTVIDIYSNSWGQPDVGDNVQIVGNCTTKTLEKATREGRNGKGAVYVFAAGNGGRFGDSCAANGYVNSIYTIGIGSATSKGVVPDYEEPCSGKMAISFIHHFGAKLNVATTDIDNECRQNFDKTSAATPTVSATIALAIEANTNLTWRDVQYLIVYTSDHDKLNHPGTRNGAGLTFSHYFGFGAVDAEALVTRARHWTSVPPQTSFSLKPSNFTYLVSNGSTEKIDMLCLNQIDECYDKVSYLEHVVVQVSLYFEGENANYAQRGQITMNLTSPRQTTSTILPLRPRDDQNEKYDNWSFLSVHFWGEYPTGTWTLTVEYRGENGTLVVSNLTVLLYGTDTEPASVQSQTQECDSSCSGGCSGPGPRLCDKCRHFRNADTLECIDQCPENYQLSHDYCIPPTSGDPCPISCKIKRDTTEDTLECSCDQESDSGALQLAISHGGAYTLLGMTLCALVNSIL